MMMINTSWGTKRRPDLLISVWPSLYSTQSTKDTWIQSSESSEGCAPVVGHTVLLFQELLWKLEAENMFPHGHMHVHYLDTVIFLLQGCAVLRQSQLAQPSGDRLVLHGAAYKHTCTYADAHALSHTLSSRMGPETEGIKEQIEFK